MLVLASLLALGPVLEVPWSCGETHACTQGNGGQSSHTGLARYAWDFGMPLGTEILAAHGGTVSSMKMDSRHGGCSNVYANDANYVLIDHHDGTAGLYLHVEGSSSRLQVGDPVATGDVIARVGQTGFSCGPHLHFQVQEICGSWWCQSVPAEFHGAGVLAQSEPLASENCGGEAVAAETDWSDVDIEPRDEAGCARSTNVDPGAGLFALVGLGLLGWRRRR
jgi:MYXO-CTERM domain-containing protein